jgi:outer membrane receptor protein involved in Fe transport
MALGQSVDGDSMRYKMDEIVVTASRSDSKIASAIGGVSQFKLDQMQALPAANAAGLLGTVPGIVFLNRDGEGNDPLPIIRGFYGGGTVEYLVVMVDGTPINQVESGLVNWDALLNQNIESIEMLRGGASALYGDAAIGGTINVRTANAANRTGLVTAQAGSFGMIGGAASIRNAIDGRRSDASIDFQTTDGFRDHGKRTRFNLDVGLGLLSTSTHRLDLRSENHVRDIESPGYLPSQIAESDPTRSASFFQSDGTKENVHRLVADGQYTGGPDWRLLYSAAGSYRNADIIGTLLLTPEFADHKLRELETTHLLGSAQYIRDWNSETISGRFQVGLDVSKGSARSDYYNLQPRPSGPGELDLVNTGLDESGESDRTTIAGYAQIQLVPIDRMLVSLGGRIDQLADDFVPLSEGTVPASSIDNTAFSPKLGVNYGYNAGALGGNLYASVSRSFKAPTLDQLYDQRTIPVQFPPYKISLSNGELEPQTGTQFEAGIYQRLPISSTVHGELQISVYRIDLKNELDFSLEEFRYVNIGESRHDGIESGLTFQAGQTTAGVSYAFQDAFQTIGEHRGNQLKAVPAHIYSANLQSEFSGILLGTSVTGASGIWLDDANSIPLSSYATVDGRIGYRFRSLTVAIDIFNLSDNHYSTTGFPDPSGGPDLYLYPAASRRVQAGVSVHL